MHYKYACDCVCVRLVVEINQTLSIFQEHCSLNISVRTLLKRNSGAWFTFYDLCSLYYITLTKISPKGQFISCSGAFQRIILYVALTFCANMEEKPLTCSGKHMEILTTQMAKPHLLIKIISYDHICYCLPKRQKRSV